MDNIIKFVRPKQPETIAMRWWKDKKPELSTMTDEEVFCLIRRYLSRPNYYAENVKALQNTPPHHWREHFRNIYMGKAGIRAVSRNIKKIRLVEES